MGKGYGISRLDLISGHEYHYDIEVPVENGLFVEIDYAKGTVTPTTDVTKTQHYISSVTNLYDSTDESDFINTPDGMKSRVLTLPEGDIVTTTQLNLTAGSRKSVDAIKKGDFAFASVGGKTAFSDVFPTSPAAVPAQKYRVVEVTTLNSYPAVAIQAEA